MPIEPAFLIALQNDGALWADAYKQNILLVGPTTLLYIIRIVNVLWQQELQARNVQDVMDRGAELYDNLWGSSAIWKPWAKACAAQIRTIQLQ